MATIWTLESVPRLFCLRALQGSGAPSYRLAGAALHCTEVWVNWACTEMEDLSELQRGSALRFSQLGACSDSLYLDTHRTLCSVEHLQLECSLVHHCRATRWKSIWTLTMVQTVLLKLKLSISCWLEFHVETCWNMLKIRSEIEIVQKPG